MEQKYFELANTIVHNKFLKHSHWVTQATYPVTQETNKRRYLANLFFGRTILAHIAWKQKYFFCLLSISLQKTYPNMALTSSKKVDTKYTCALDHVDSSLKLSELSLVCK